KADTDQKRFEELAKSARSDVILCGHSHEHFSKTVDGVQFINPGSVGRPFDGDVRASYVILELNRGRVNVIHRRLNYPHAKMIRKLRKAKFPPLIVQSLEEGVSLDVVKKQLFDTLTEDKIMKEAKQWAKSFRYDKKHTGHVAMLAEQLFREMRSMWKFNVKDRILLLAAAHLHDVGWDKGRSSHHKRSCKMIIKNNQLPFIKSDKIIVGLVARYHRKALPQAQHKSYKDLSPNDQLRVQRLAAILRLCDGLDYEHNQIVKNIQVKGDEKTITLQIEYQDKVDRIDEIRLEGKEDLFKKLLQKQLQIQIKE
ncbi:MAG: metallophosphoesterase family protein, partial [Candidatus Omnitrophica bacterium]|nr:metallophosphoesterase family protein [Candidatus Omnitrophota bacterium]